jgi:phage tail-like protein
MPRVQLPLIYLDDVSTLGTGAVSQPYVVSRVPEPGETDVPTSTPIEIVIVDTGTSGLSSLAAATTVSITTVAAGTVAAFIQGVGFDATYSGSNFTAAESPNSSVLDEHKIQLIRNTPFSSQEIVTVAIHAQTADGKVLNQTYTFQIEDLTVPTIASAYTQGLTNLIVVFSEPVLMDTSARGALHVRPLSGRITFTAPDFIEAGNGNFATDNVGDFICTTGALNALNNSYVTIFDIISSQEISVDETTVTTEESSLNVLCWTGPYKLVPVMEDTLLIPSFTPAITAATQIDAQTISLTLDQELSPNRPYTLYGTNINDLNFVPNTMSMSSVVFTAQPLPVVTNRNFCLWDNFIPGINKRQDTSGDNQRLVRCFDEVTQLLLNDIDNFGNLQDVDLMPSDALDVTLANLGNPFLFLDDDLTKRKTINGLVQTFKDKGIDRGIENAVLFFTGITVTVQAFNLEDGWILGQSSLGYDTILGTSEAFLIYSFELVTDTILTDTQQTIIQQIVSEIQPAHTHFVRFVMPTS